MQDLNPNYNIKYLRGIVGILSLILIIGTIVLFYAIINKFMQGSRELPEIIACLEKTDFIPLESRSVKFEIVGKYIIFATIEPHNRIVIYEPCTNKVIKSIEIK